ncbi:hypothetical protein [Agathobaculum sp.]|uniref:hypothetical protein n=1 Tax=Agathobaculum sp. TaxID=2048138 RepID=UPI003AB198AE
MKRNKLRRVTATALLLSFALPQCAQAAAPTVETDETVYINMDYYGAPTNTRIVKGVNLNGHTEFTDFGDYKDVYNMSTFDEPTLKEGSVYWKLDTDKNRFYYECIPNDTVNIQMPWNFDVSYKLNGVPVEADQCAGASGTIQMDIHAVPNTYASDYYKNNMMLVCATGIDMSKALSIDAPGAQIQSFGTYKLVMFMGLPGEENTFTVRIGSNDFESMGLIMFMTPATTSALDIMSSMRDIKDRLENSGDNLYTGVSSMLSTMQAVQGSLSSMSSGISGIDQVRKQLIKDRGTLDPRTDAALNALDELTGKSDSLIPELNSAKETLTSLNATTSSILTTLEESGADVTEYQKLLEQIKTSLGNLEDLFDDLDDETDNSSWTIAQIRSASEDLKDELDALTQDLRNLSDSLDDLDLETPVSTELTNYVKKMASTASSTVLDTAYKKGYAAGKQAAIDVGKTDEAEIEAIAQQYAEAAKASAASQASSAASQAQASAYNNAQALAALMTGIKSGSSAVTSDMQSMTKQLKSVTEKMSDLLNATNSLLKDLEDIADVFDEYKGLPQDFTAEGKKLTELANGSLDRVNKMLADIPALRESLDSLTKTATSSIDKTTDLMSSTTKALSTSYDLVNTANSVLRSVRSQADASTQATIDSLLDTLGKLSGSTASGQMQTATDSIHSAVKDAETDLEDDTNVLNIDTSADLESVTSSMNPSPSSLQFILRTEEISVDDDDDDGTSDQDAADEGVFARICNIFKKLFTAITGVFASDD